MSNQIVIKPEFSEETQKVLDNCERRIIDYTMDVVERYQLIGEQLKQAKQAIIRETKDDRAPGFIRWTEEKFGFSKMTVSRMIRAYEKGIVDKRLLWGKEREKRIGNTGVTDPFVAFLKAVHLDGLIDACRIKVDEDTLFCRARDEGGVIISEVSLKHKVEGLEDDIGIYDVGKLIKMVSCFDEPLFRVKDDGSSRALLCSQDGLSMEYALGDPDLIELPPREEIVGDFLKEETVSAELTNDKIRSIIRYAGILATDYVRLLTDGGDLKAELGEIDRIRVDLCGCDAEGLSVLHDSETLKHIFKTVLDLGMTTRLHVRTDFPSVVESSDGGLELRCLFSPIDANDECKNEDTSD